jgi:hypothetical protein
LGLLVGIVFSRSRSQKHQRHETTIRDRDKTYDKSGQQNVRGNITVDYSENVIRDRRFETNQQQRTQNSIKNATWAAFIAASIYAAISAAIWLEMQSQTRIESLAQRPWIAIKEPLLIESLQFHGNIAKIALRHTIENVGRTPAIAKVSDEILPIAEWWGTRIGNCCREELEVVDTAWAVIPNYPMPYDVPKEFSIDSTMKDSKGNLKVQVIGCISYKITGSKEIWQTAFVGQISMKDKGVCPRPGFRFNIPVVDGETDPTNLCVVDLLMREPIY